MKQKNNLLFIANLNGKEKFSFRKLSVGLVTIALGTTFYLESSPTVKAADLELPTQLQPTKEIAPKSETSTLDAQNATPNSVESSIQHQVIKKDPKVESSNFQANPRQLNNEVISVTGDKTNTSLIANVTQGSVNINFQNTYNKPIYLNKNDQIKISIEDKNNLLRFKTLSSTIDDFSINRSDTPTTKKFSFTYTGNNNGILSNFEATLPFTADDSAVKKYNEDYGHYPDFNLPVTVTFLNNQPITKNLPIKISPYQDLVDTKEILHGFILGPKVIWTPGKDGNPGKDGVYTEYGANYTGPELSAAADISKNQQKNARLMQYGIEWNYGSTIEPVSLNNVLAHIKFSDGQTILPSTIKVFKVPTNVSVVDSNGQRIDINNYYGKITSQGEDPNFEKFLISSISPDKKQITIDQQGDFTVNGQDYSKNGAYFIQLDTLLDTNNLPKWVENPGTGPSITNPIRNQRDWDASGTANTTNTSTQTYTNFKFNLQVDRIVQIHFIDEDTGKEIDKYYKSIISKSNTTVNNPAPDVIKQLINENYIVDTTATNGKESIHSKKLTQYNPITQNFKIDNFDNAYENKVIPIKNTSPNYYVYLYHKTEPISDKKTVTETIHYIYEDGRTAHPDVQQILTFTKTVTKDLVTGKEVSSSWDDPQTFSAKVSPKIEGYTSDIEKIAAITVQHDSDDIERTVVYKKKPVQPEKPVQPDKPAQPDKPVQPDKPAQPDKPTQPDKPVQPDKSVKLDKLVQTEKPVQTESKKSVQSGKVSSIKKQSVAATNQPTLATKKRTLPQTGTHTNNISLIGLALSTVSVLLGLAGSKLKRKN